MTQRPETQTELLRIGELSRRVDVPVASLRAWEARYGLLAPNRTKGGFRLYGPDDVARVLAMRANLERGLSAAEAARLALSESRVGVTPLLAEAAAELDAALSIFDEASAQAVLDRLFGSLSVDAALREVVVPYLHELGERWQRGEVSIAHEHFASNVVRGRLMAMARGWGRGSGPLVVLACAEDEQHDIPLLLFGLLMRTYGWRVGYLGADTPLPSLVQAVREMPSSAVVVSGTAAGVFDGLSAGLQEVALLAPLYIAGAAASEDLARQAHGVYLDGDMFAAASTLANERRSAGVEH
jgi:MerR family transcriptional regulator, light-induced transcriptional regulator